MKILELRRKLGLLISQLRKSKKYEQADFAQRIGIGKITLSKIERGKTDFRISSLDSVARGLEVDVIQLFNYAQNVPLVSSKNLEKLFYLLKDEEEDIIKAVLQQAETLIAFKKK